MSSPSDEVNPEDADPSVSAELLELFVELDGQGVPAEQMGAAFDEDRNQS